MANLNEILTAEHPEYKARKMQMEFFLRAYEGGDALFDAKYIFPHTREDGSDHADRVKRAAYFNYCMDGITVYADHIFKRPISRTAEHNPQVLDDFRQAGNVDRQSNTLQEFQKHSVAIPMMIWGHTFVLVDKPMLPDGVQTMADAEAQGLTDPYFVEISPQNVFNWSTDRVTGKFNWVMYRETVLNDNTWDAGGGKQEFVWVWTTNEWMVFEKDNEGNFQPAMTKGENPQPRQGVHGLGEVPIVLYRNKRKRGCRVVGLSLIEDVAYINRDVLNQSNLIGEFNYRQCFKQMAPKDASAGLDTLMMPPDTQKLELGTGKFLPVPMEYVGPGTDNVEWQHKWISTSIMEIYRLFRIRPQTDKRVAESGESKQWDFHESNNKIAGVASSIKSGEEEQLRLWYKQKGMETIVSSDYPKDFDIRGINQEIEDALGIDTLPLGPTFKTRYNTRLAHRLDEDMTPEIAQDVEAEIEAEQAETINEQRETEGLAA